MVSRLHFVSLAILFLVLLVPGCTIGFRKIDLQCQSMVHDDEKIECLREVAINYAFEKKFDPNGESLAVSECDQIRAMGSTVSWYVPADTYADLCYADIAKYLQDESICDRIGKKTSGGVLGADASRSLCISEVSKQKSFIEGKDNYKCGVLFVFPLILLAILRTRK